MRGHQQLDKAKTLGVTSGKNTCKNNLAPAVYEFIIEAPMIAHKCQPGQFIMIRTDENSERIL